MNVFLILKRLLWSFILAFTISVILALIPISVGLTDSGLIFQVGQVTGITSDNIGGPLMWIWLIGLIILISLGFVFFKAFQKPKKEIMNEIYYNAVAPLTEAEKKEKKENQRKKSKRKR